MAAPTLPRPPRGAGRAQHGPRGPMARCSCPARRAPRNCWPTHRAAHPGPAGQRRDAARRCHRRWRCQRTGDARSTWKAGSPQRVLWPLIDGRYRDRTRPVRPSRARVPWTDWITPAQTLPRGHHRATVPVAKPELRHAAGEGRGVRRGARCRGRAPQHRHPQHPDLPIALHVSPEPCHAVCRHSRARHCSSAAGGMRKA
jgi:hypothetical protein